MQSPLYLIREPKVVPTLYWNIPVTDASTFTEPTSTIDAATTCLTRATDGPVQEEQNALLSGQLPVKRICGCEKGWNYTERVYIFPFFCNNK